MTMEFSGRFSLLPEFASRSRKTVKTPCRLVSSAALDGGRLAEVRRLV